VNGIDFCNFTILSLYMVMTGIIPHRHHPRDRVIVLLDSKCKHRRKAERVVKQEVALEADDLESISSKNEGEVIPVKGEGMSSRLLLFAIAHGQTLSYPVHWTMSLSLQSTPRMRRSYPISSLPSHLRIPSRKSLPRQRRIYLLKSLFRRRK
jgi:hypothetical protein